MTRIALLAYAGLLTWYVVAFGADVQLPPTYQTDFEVLNVTPSPTYTPTATATATATFTPTPTPTP